MQSAGAGAGLPLGSYPPIPDSKDTPDTPDTPDLPGTNELPELPEDITTSVPAFIPSAPTTKEPVDTDVVDTTVEVTQGQEPTSTVERESAPVRAEATISTSTTQSTDDFIRVTKTRTVPPKTTGFATDSKVLFSLDPSSSYSDILRLPDPSSRTRLNSSATPSSSSIQSASSTPAQPQPVLEKQDESKIPSYAIAVAVVGGCLLLLCLLACYRKTSKRKRDRRTLTNSMVVTPYPAQPEITQTREWEWQPPRDPDQPFNALADAPSYVNFDTASTVASLYSSKTDRFSTSAFPAVPMQKPELRLKLSDGSGMSWYKDFDEKLDNPFPVHSPLSHEPSSPSAAGKYSNLRVPSSVYTRDSFAGDCLSNSADSLSPPEPMPVARSKIGKQVKFGSEVGQAL